MTTFEWIQQLIIINIFPKKWASFININDIYEYILNIIIVNANQIQLTKVLLVIKDKNYLYNIPLKLKTRIFQLKIKVVLIEIWLIKYILFYIMFLYNKLLIPKYSFIQNPEYNWKNKNTFCPKLEVIFLNKYFLLTIL